MSLSAPVFCVGPAPVGELWPAGMRSVNVNNTAKCGVTQVLRRFGCDFLLRYLNISCRCTFKHG